MEVINFFDPDITLRVEHSSDPDMIGQPVTIGEFTTLYGAGGLCDMGDGSLYYRVTGRGDWMRGPEATDNGT